MVQVINITIFRMIVSMETHFMVSTNIPDLFLDTLCQDI